MVGVVGTSLAVLLLFLLSGVASSARADSLTPAHTGEAFAALEVLDPVVEVGEEGGDWRVAQSGLGLGDGDWLRTDTDGFAEVLYLDGSRTRLSGDTEFQVVSLAGDALAPVIHLKLDVGRTWNRVQGVTGQRGAYEVETAVGTAAVRGTVFIVECDRRPVCTFTVLEGVVVVTTPDGRQLVVNQDESLTLGLDGNDNGPGDAPAPGGGGAPGAGGPDSTDPGGSGAAGSATGGSGAGSGSTGSGSAGSGSAGSGSATGGSGSTGASGSTDGSTGAATGPDGRLGIVEVSREQAPPGVLGVRPWAARNLALDRVTDRYGTDQESCAVTINGRNADLADTPATAIETRVDEQLTVDALATGQLEGYSVQLGLGPFSMQAARGTILPAEDGDRSTFRGTVDVGEYATWGVGLYEVRASTSGTRCATTAFVNVAPSSPAQAAFSVTALLALLVTFASIIAFVGAVGRAASFVPPTGKVS